MYFHYEFVLLFIRLVHVYETPANLNNLTRAFTLPLTLGGVAVAHLQVGRLMVRSLAAPVYMPKYL